MIFNALDETWSYNDANCTQSSGLDCWNCNLIETGKNNTSSKIKVWLQLIYVQLMRFIVAFKIYWQVCKYYIVWLVPEKNQEWRLTYSQEVPLLSSCFVWSEVRKPLRRPPALCSTLYWDCVGQHAMSHFLR